MQLREKWTNIGFIDTRIWIQMWSSTLWPWASDLTSLRLKWLLHNSCYSTGCKLLQILVPSLTKVSFPSFILTTNHFWGLPHAWLLQGHSPTAPLANYTTGERRMRQWESSVDSKNGGNDSEEGIGLIHFWYQLTISWDKFPKGCCPTVNLHQGKSG